MTVKLCLRSPSFPPKEGNSPTGGQKYITSVFWRMNEIELCYSWSSHTRPHDSFYAWWPEFEPRLQVGKFISRLLTWFTQKKIINARLHLLLQFLPASSTLWLFSSSNMLIVMKNLLVHSMSEAAAVWSLIMQQLGCWSDDLNKPCSRSSLDNFLLVSHWLILTHWDLDGLALERLHHGWFS